MTTKTIRGQDKHWLETAAGRIAHRGPDSTRVRYYGKGVMATFHRLAITDPTPQGMQPFEDDRYICMVNGEIYNFKEIRAELESAAIANGENMHFHTHSDCEVVLPLFRHIVGDDEPTADHAMKMCEILDGEFAIVIYDQKTGWVFACVDELRVRPLFYGWNDKQLAIASEQKALVDLGLETISAISSGVCVFTMTKHCNYDNAHIMKSHKFHPTKHPYFDFDYFKRLPGPEYLDITEEQAMARLRELLMANVERKLHPEREFGFLLSGGLDSSLICGIAARQLAPTRIRTFTVGFDRNAPDVIAAREVAKHIDSIHTELIFSYEDGLQLIPDVIHTNESWDQTTTRASVPMALAMRAIKRAHPEMAVIYSGEVADELLMGYLEWQSAPDPTAAREHVIERLRNITFYDGLRADRTVSAVGCELRLPFFGKALLEFVLRLPSQYLMPQMHNGVEKWLLRKAFSGLGYLPESIIWRTKNAMSDATSVLGSRGSCWKEKIKKCAANTVTDSRFNARADIHPRIRPQTKEDMWYAEEFDLHGYNAALIPGKWMPAWAPEGLTDSSATALEGFTV